MEFRRHTLANGLQIVAECNSEAYSLALGFFVAAGSRDETPEIAGVSHFLEHMAFKGSEQRSAADVNRQLDEIGSYCNASTSVEVTNYYAAALPEHQARLIEILGDVLRPALRPDDFAVEKEVILKEILMYQEQPPYGADDRCMALHFGDHALGRSVLGSSESVGALQPDAMREYFRRRYSPRNIVLAAAGRVDFDALIRQAQIHCGGWEDFPAPRAFTPPATAPRFEVLTKPQAAQQYALQICDAPGADHALRFAARLLTIIVGDDSGSRMFWEFVDTGRAECCAMSAAHYVGAGVFNTFLCCAPEQTQENLNRLAALLAAVQRDGVTEAELERVKRKVGAHIVLSGERPANRLFSIGSNWLQRGEYRSVKETVAQYQAVTRADIQAVLEQFPLTRPTTVAVGPLTGLRAPA